MFTKNESKYYYDIQYKCRLDTKLYKIESELNEINNLFKLFRQNESSEKVNKLNQKKRYINNKYINIINMLKREILNCNKRIKYNKLKFLN